MTLVAGELGFLLLPFVFLPSVSSSLVFVLSLSLSLVCSLCSSVFFFSQEFIPSAGIYRAPSLSSCGCWSCFRHNFGEITTPTVLPLSDCWGPNFLPKRRVMEAKETATIWALKWLCFLWEFDIAWAFFRCLLRLERPCSREEEDEQSSLGRRRFLGWDGQFQFGPWCFGIVLIRTLGKL